MTGGISIPLLHLICFENVCVPLLEAHWPHALYTLCQKQPEGKHSGLSLQQPWEKGN